MTSNISITLAGNYNSTHELISYISKLLKITFEARDSSYAGNYQKANFDNGTIMVYPNFNEIENEWKYERHKDYQYLIGIRIEKGKKIERTEMARFLEDVFSKAGFIILFKKETPANS